MTHVLRALPDLTRVAFAGVAAYRAEMVIWILSATMPLVMLALWDSVAADGPIAGLDAQALGRYFVATLIVRQATSSWLLWSLNYEIRTGTLSSRLLKPMHPLVSSSVDMIAATPLRLVVMAPLLVGLFAFRPDLVWLPSPLSFLAFLVALAAAWIVNYCIQALFATLSFWIDKSDSLFGVWFSLYTLLSGYIAPLDVFPTWASSILRLSPFRVILGGPVEMLAGMSTPAEIASDLVVAVAWAVALMVATALAWRAGIRRYGAFGA